MDVRVAIVHDYLNQMGGAERVVATLHSIFPEAPIFTSIVDYDKLWFEFRDADIRVSWMQGLPGIKRHFKKYFFLYPLAFESFRFDDYDIVISSSSAFAKGVKKGSKALHVCYCHTPMRFVWDYKRYVEKEDLGLFARNVVPLFIKGLKDWDLKTKDRPDYYVANSNTVKKRIRDYYGIDAEVIFPPVNTSRFKPSRGVDNFYLIVSRLNSYKRIDIAVEAFKRLGIPLKIVGDGPYKETLMELAGPHTEFTGWLNDRDMAFLYSRCRALIFPGEEDFGIVPLEANASGRPVIAYRAGGALDTVVEGLNGIFFDTPTPEAIIEAVRKVEDGRYSFDPVEIRNHAIKFDTKVFVDRFTSFVWEKYSEFNGTPLKAGCTDG